LNDIWSWGMKRASGAGWSFSQLPSLSLQLHIHYDMEAINSSPEASSFVPLAEHQRERRKLNDIWSWGMKRASGAGWSFSVSLGAALLSQAHRKAPPRAGSSFHSPTPYIIQLPSLSLQLHIHSIILVPIHFLLGCEKFT
jgi:hypothetical protein